MVTQLLTLPALLNYVKTQRDTSYCASLLQNHGAQLAEFIFTDLCTLWENKFNGKEYVYI